MRHLGIVLLAVAAISAGTPAQAAPGKKAEPKWEQVESSINRTLSARKGYQSGDLIDRSDAQQIFARLDELGWQVPDSGKVLGQVLPDNDFMVTHLRVKEGTRFMRNVASYSEGYDRVDRFLKLPRSQIMLADLITNPGGFELFKYMIEAPGGVEMGKMLERIPLGKDFNQPTGKIYTGPELVSRLRKSYDESFRQGR